MPSDARWGGWVIVAGMTALATGLGGITSDEGVSALSIEDEKRRARAQAVGLFRYQLICPALDAGLSTKARGRLVRHIAAREHTDPFGTPVRYSRDTLDRWIRRYRAGGFAELVPSARTCVPRTDTAVLEMAAALKRENPARTAAQVARILRAATGWAPSESTLLRLFRRCELIGPAAGDTPVVFGRFEAENPNDRWTGDALHGPRIGGRKTYLFAFLDDHSRLICGYRFGFAEDAVRLGAALQPALAARRVPASVYVDNGSAFVDSWLLRACAKLGIRLVHSTPHRPQGRGKIERFFRTVREQFGVEIVDTTGEQLAATGVDHRTGLLELNRLFTAWVETEYHRRIHTETGQSPWERWEAGWTRLGRRAAMPTAADLTEAFLWSEYRTVTKTATVSLHSQHLRSRHRPDRTAGGVGVLPVRPGNHRCPLPGGLPRPGGAAHHHPPHPPQSPTRNPRTTPAGDRDRLPGTDRRDPSRTDPRRPAHRLQRPVHQQHTRRRRQQRQQQQQRQR